MPIFICHSHRDDSFVTDLCARLSQHKYATWADHMNIPAGITWDKAVEEALTASELMILVLSPHSVDSDEARAEWSEFKDQGKPIIPLLVKSCPVPLRLKLLQHIDMRDETQFEDRFQRLLTSLVEIPRHIAKTAQMSSDKLKTSEIEIAETKAKALNLHDVHDTILGVNQLLLAFPKLGKTGVFDLDQEKLFVGWHDRKTNIRPDVDLTKYLAMENGVSRQHALLSRTETALSITDLDSMNGTFVSNRQTWKRLKPNEPFELKNEMVIRLGALVIQTFFKLPPAS